MKTIKYFWLARLIKAILQMLLLIFILIVFFNLYLGVFSSKPYIDLNGGTLGYNTTGYNLKAGLTISIPDSIFYYKNGNSKSVITNSADYKKTKNDTLTDIVVNNFKVYANENISLRNEVFLSDNVIIRAISKNSYHQIFWVFTASLGLMFSCVFILILIKLTNRYMDDEIFHPRVFKLITWLGILLIGGELVSFIVNIINMILIQSPKLTSTSVGQNASYPFAQVSLHPASINHTNVIIGILIILLAQVFKQAIITKQEQDLTI